MQTIKTKSDTIHFFKGVSEYADRTPPAASRDWIKKKYEAKTELTSPSLLFFTGANDMAEALEYAKRGWPEGLATMQSARASMPRPNARGAAKDYDVAGMYPDAARAAAGDPCSMVTPTEGELKGQSIISLVIQCGYNCDIAAASVINQAAAICSLVDALESSGQARIELTGYHGTRCNRKDADNHALHALITLKSAHDPLDLARLAGALHPSSHRRLFLRLIEAHDENGWATSVHKNYGMNADPKSIADHIPPQSLILPNPNNTTDRTPAESFKALSDWAAEHGLNIITA
jgi:hypothetical protein